MERLTASLLRYIVILVFTCNHDYLKMGEITIDNEESTTRQG